MISKKKVLRLELLATKIRKDIVKMIYMAGSGHTGGSLSVTDILVSLYFGKVLNYKAEEPSWADRDRVVLSKGHAAPALYAILAHAGFFDKEHLKTLRQSGSILQGHPDMRKIPGVDFNTGSLGQGSSVAAGIAYAARLDNKKYNVYSIVGDGELQEGMNWEAFMLAGNLKLDNLCVIVDKNNLQIDGKVSDINSLEPLEKKFNAFNFETKEINGHSYKQILKSLNYFKNKKRQKPYCIIADTIKGKGVPEIEGDYRYHGKPLPKEVYETSMKRFDDILKKYENN